MRLATWNINSVRLRLDLLGQLAAEAAPDVICLQEIKVETASFPAAAIADLGYPHQQVYGIKGYHGVAIVSRRPLNKAAARDWCGKRDGRHVHAEVDLDDGTALELHNFYIPSGGDEPDPAANDKFAHKLQFLDELAEWWQGRRRAKRRAVMVGDFNIAPLETDVWSHAQLLNVVSHTPVEVAHLDRLRGSHDWVDAVRAFIPPSERLYSWWSYRSRDWRASNRGRRLDHVWVTPALAGSLTAASVLSDARDWPKPSDHAPVLVDFA